MSVWTDTLSTFRSLFDAAMVDTVTVTRTTSRGTLNTTTGRYTPTTVTVHSGAALIRPAGHGTVTFGEENLEVSRPIVLLPSSVGRIEPEDVITVTASPQNPQLVGAVLVVREVQEDSHDARAKVIADFDREVLSDTVTPAAAAFGVTFPQVTT